MTTTKTYNSEDEVDVFYLKIEHQAQGMLHVLSCLDGRLRSIVKYGDDVPEAEWAGRLRSYMRDVCFDHEVNLDLDV